MPAPDCDRPPVSRPLRRLTLLDVRIDDIAPGPLMDMMADTIDRRGRLTVVNANAHLMNLAQSRPWLRELFEGAGVAFCDGAGVQFAAGFKTGRKPARHTPPQWIEPLARRLANADARVYWLGGSAEAVQAAARNLQDSTGLRAAGYHHGFFDETPGSIDNERVLADIRQARPDLLLINMGMPRQERWLYDNWDQLDVPVALTAGALVDHVAGRARRPPPWVADCGMEWLVRLAIEPRRLFRRYVVGLPLFGLRCLAAMARERPWRSRPQYSASR